MLESINFSSKFTQKFPYCSRPGANSSQCSPVMRIECDMVVRVRVGDIERVVQEALRKRRVGSSQQCQAGQSGARAVTRNKIFSCLGMRSAMTGNGIKFDA